MVMQKVLRGLVPSEVIIHVDDYLVMKKTTRHVSKERRSVSTPSKLSQLSYGNIQLEMWRAAPGTDVGDLAV